jgi:hypothetical protein
LSVNPDDIDEDGDGKIQADEIKKWWNSDSTTDAQRRFAQNIPGFKLTEDAWNFISSQEATQTVGKTADRIIEIVIEDIVKPLFTGFWRLSILLVGVVGVVFLGENGKVGLGPGLPGIADLPLILSTALIEATEPVGETVLLTISGFNADIVSALEGAGLAQFPVLVVVQFAELTLVVFVLVRLADLVGLGALLDLVTKPITGLVGRLRG